MTALGHARAWGQQELVPAQPCLCEATVPTALTAVLHTQGKGGGTLSLWWCGCPGFVRWPLKTFPYTTHGSWSFSQSCRLSGAASPALTNRGKLGASALTFQQPLGELLHDSESGPAAAIGMVEKSKNPYLT